MTKVIYKISSYVNWKSNSGTYTGGSSNVSSVPNHNALVGLQGETPYYHLGTTDYSRLTQLSFINSVTEDTSYQVSLVNDLASPGNNMVYGSNYLGTKGWYIQSGVSLSPQNNILYWDVNNNWYMPYAGKGSGSGGSGGTGGTGGTGSVEEVSEGSGGILYNWFVIGTEYANPPVDAVSGALYNWYAVTKGVSSNTYGALYNWYAATYSISGASIAPPGWHVPTISEWSDLLSYVQTGTPAPYTSDAGIHLKEAFNTHWAVDDYNDGVDSTGDNTSGFNAWACGNRGEDGPGIFGFRTYSTSMWASDVHPSYPTKGYFIGLSYSRPDFQNDYNAPRSRGCSVRLIKNSTSLIDGETGTMTDYDGNVYDTICIGSQEWMTSNLKVTHYTDGTSIPLITDNSAWAADTTGAMCYYDNIFADSISDEFSPTGWHVPTDDEWKALATYLGGESVAGAKLKETGLTHWNAANPATNESGFTMIGSGIRETTGVFDAIKEYCQIWSSTANSSFIYYCVQSHDVSSFDASFGSALSTKTRGFSVRLIKDDQNDPGTVTDYDGNVYDTVKIGNQVWMAENYRCTHYNTGEAIPIVLDNTEWSALTTGAMCYYNNIP